MPTSNTPDGPDLTGVAAESEDAGSRIWLSIDRRLAITLVWGFVIVGVATVLVTFNVQMRNVEARAAIQADAVISQMLATRAVYTENVVTKLVAADMPIADVFEVNDEAIPLPATLVHLISARVNAQGLYSIDLISPWPINPEKGPRTVWEQEAVLALISDNESAQLSTQTIDGVPTLLYMRSDFASASACVSCHNAHAQSPRADFEVGDMMGALVVQTPLDAGVTEARVSTAWISVGVLLALVLAVFVILRSRADHVGRLESEVAANKALMLSKDRLVAAVSHELRTPLTGIVGFAELLGDEALSAQERSDAEELIRSQAGDLSNIIDDLLTAARADMGKLVVQHSHLDLREQAEQTISHMHYPDPEVIGLTGEPVWTNADAPRVRQIIRNLLTNAVRYGGSAIHISTKATGGQAVLCVTDDGEGVPASKVGAIFDAYEIAHEEGIYPGSVGLGLNISRRLARLMGGDITYSRNAGQTEFRLALPLAEPGS